MITPVVADIYHGNPINFTEVVQSGIWGIIHKCTQGFAADPLYARRQIASRACGVLWAAYDFATGDNPVNNADNFLKRANLSSKDGAWLDFEDNTYSQMSGNQAYAFIDHVNQKLGRACGIYGGNRIREHIDPQDKKWIDLAKVTPLWYCRYMLRNFNDTAQLFQVITPPHPWTKITLIQYTGDGVGPPPHSVVGLQSGADLNAFNGARSELEAVWAGMPTTPAQPQVVA
jgi:lysozyme